MDGMTQVPEEGREGAESGAIAGRLTQLSSTVEPDEMGELWLFPPLPQVTTSAEFLLFTRILDEGSRALYSARLVPANGKPTHQVIVEHGTLPVDRLPRFINDLQRRLGDHAPPRHIRIEGARETWDRLVAELRAHAESDESV